MLGSDCCVWYDKSPAYLPLSKNQKAKSIHALRRCVILFANIAANATYATKIVGCQAAVKPVRSFCFFLAGAQHATLEEFAIRPRVRVEFGWLDKRGCCFTLPGVP
jgi:hypothetical protein